MPSTSTIKVINGAIAERDLKQMTAITPVTHIRLTPAQQQAVTTILNLRKLTEQTGTRTTKAQNDILRALNSTDLSAVANALAQ